MYKSHPPTSGGTTILVGYFLLLLLVAVPRPLVAKRHNRPDFCDGLSGDSNGSFLWMVKQDPPSYFFGTIHVPYTRVWDHVPNNTKRAFEMTDSVVFELDLTDPLTISALTSCQLLPKGESLQELLPPDLFSRLSNHLDYIKTQMPRWVSKAYGRKKTTRGIYADYLFDAITGNWQRKRPVWVMLMVNSLTESDIRSRGVPVLDLFLAQQAEKLGKTTGAVEEVEEQCTPLNGLNVSQVLFALNHTLHQHEKYRAGLTDAAYSTDDLIKHYNCGDLDPVIFSQDTTQSLQVPQLGNSSLAPEEASLAQHIDSYFKKELIYRRNQRMGERVLQVMEQNPGRSFFFAFGAGHFIGNYSVLDVVRQAGLDVKHVPADFKLKRHKRKGHYGAVLPPPKLLRNFSQAPNRLMPHHQVDPAFARFLSRQHLPGGSANILRGHISSTPPPSKSSHFNHLWVRIDAPDAIQHSSSQEQDTDEGRRVWYGTSTGSTLSSYYATMLLLMTVLQLSLKGLLL